MEHPPQKDAVGNELKFGDVVMLHYQPRYGYGLHIYVAPCKSKGADPSEFGRIISLRKFEKDSNSMYNHPLADKKLDLDKIQPMDCDIAITNAMFKVGYIDFVHKTFEPCVLFPDLDKEMYQNSWGVVNVRLKDILP